MAQEGPVQTFGQFIDVPFNLSLTIILAFTSACILRSRAILLLLVFVASAVILVFDTTSTRGETIKVMAELPLGLGSVLAFLVANRSFQAQYLRPFTMYVNIAVYGNIGMMVGTPGGGTLRGFCSKITCLMLFVWIVQQGHHMGWRTIMLHKQLFVFTAVSKSWIFAHAVYRFVLLTLPTFGSGRRHRLMELYSLTMTFALSKRSNLPFEHCFGMADTLVVPAAAAWSSLASTFDLIPRDTKKAPSDIGSKADYILSAVSLAVASFALVQVVRTARLSSQSV